MYEDPDVCYGAIPHPVYGPIDFVGEMFLWGLTGASAFHFAGGLRRGGLAAAVHAVRANAPRVAGTIGAYSTVLTAVETAASVARESEGDDVWCAIPASAVTFGLHGVRRCALLGVAGVVALAGINHAIMEWQSRNNFVLRQKKKMERGEPAFMAAVAASASRTAPPPPDDDDAAVPAAAGGHCN